jgi:hypothetical protein
VISVFVVHGTFKLSTVKILYLPALVVEGKSAQKIMHVSHGKRLLYHPLQTTRNVVSQVAEHIA